MNQSLSQTFGIVEHEIMFLHGFARETVQSYLKVPEKLTLYTEKNNEKHEV
jgi:hypothetical protein